MLTISPKLHIRRPSPTTAEFTVTTCPPATLSVRFLFAVVFILRVLFALSVLLLLHSSWTISSFTQQQQQQLQQQNHLPYATVGLLGTAATNTPSSIMVTTSSSGISSAYENYYYYNNNDDDNSRLQEAGNTDAAALPLGPGEKHIIIPVLTRPTTIYTTAWVPYLLQQIHLSPVGRMMAGLAASANPSLLLPLCIALLYLTTLRVHTTESLLVLRGLGIQTSSTGGSYLASWRAGTRFIPTEKIRDVLINEAFRGFAVRYYLVVVVDGEDDVVVVFPRMLPRRAIVERVWRGVRGCLWEPQDGGVPNGVTGRKWEDKASSNG